MRDVDEAADPVEPVRPVNPADRGLIDAVLGRTVVVIGGGVVHRAAGLVQMLDEHVIIVSPHLGRLLLVRGRCVAVIHVQHRILRGGQERDFDPHREVPRDAVAAFDLVREPVIGMSGLPAHRGVGEQDVIEGIQGFGCKVGVVADAYEDREIRQVLAHLGVTDRDLLPGPASHSGAGTGRW